MYAAGTRDEGERSIWTFYEAVFSRSTATPQIRPSGLGAVLRAFRFERNRERKGAYSPPEPSRARYGERFRQGAAGSEGPGYVKRSLCGFSHGWSLDALVKV